MALGTGRRTRQPYLGRRRYRLYSCASHRFTDVRKFVDTKATFGQKCPLRDRETRAPSERRSKRARTRESKRERERDGVPNVSRHIYRGQNTTFLFSRFKVFELLGVLIYISFYEQAGESLVRRGEEGKKKRAALGVS